MLTVTLQTVSSSTYNESDGRQTDSYDVGGTLTSGGTTPENVTTAWNVGDEYTEATTAQWSLTSGGSMNLDAVSVSSTSNGRSKTEDNTVDRNGSAVFTTHTSQDLSTTGTPLPEEGEGERGRGGARERGSEGEGESSSSAISSISESDGYRYVTTGQISTSVSLSTSDTVTVDEQTDELITHINASDGTVDPLAGPNIVNGGGPATSGTDVYHTESSGTGVHAVGTETHSFATGETLDLHSDGTVTG